MIILQPSLKKNDKKARLLIYTVSIVVFAAVVFLSKYKLQVGLGFNVHVFAKANAIINSLVAILLLAGLFTIKQKNYFIMIIFSRNTFSPSSHAIKYIPLLRLLFSSIDISIFPSDIFFVIGISLP